MSREAEGISARTSAEVRQGKLNRREAGGLLGGGREESSWEAVAELEEPLLGRLPRRVDGVNAAPVTTGAAQDIDAEGVLVEGGPVEASGGAALLLLRLRGSRRCDGWCRERHRRTQGCMGSEDAVIWASLAPEQRTTLQALDAEHPLHLEVSGVLRVLSPLKVLTSHRRAKAIVELARAAKRKRPEFPVRLEDLALPEPKRTDAWGNAFVLSAATDVIEVRSPGPDDASPDDDVVETGEVGQ